MFHSQSGRLLVYASSFAQQESRLKPVRAATEKMAKLLGMKIEVKTFGNGYTPIYVCYENGEEEPIPLYCNKGEEQDAQEIYATLKNMVFVLSFHPKHSGLRRARREIMRFS